MDSLSGTVVYTRDLALELRRRGHRPLVYTWLTGKISREVESAGVEVVTDLWRLKDRPDVIHGHHRPLVRGALLRFGDVPAVAFCHNPTDPWDAPAPDPRIRRYLGVSELCQRRLLDLGAPAGEVGSRPNFVDLGRFGVRGPLPARPARALAFSNNASETTFLPAVRAAADRLEIDLAVVGRESGHSVDHPEEILGEYDLVFAVGKSALEAMAVGAAVVLCDRPGLGPMVTSTSFPRLRAMNFGLAALTDPVTPDRIVEAVAGYDAADATRVRDLVRAHCGLEEATTDLVEIYWRVIAEAEADTRAGSPAARADRRLAVARYRLAKRPAVAFYRAFGLGPHPVPAPFRPAYGLARSTVRRLLGVR